MTPTEATERADPRSLCPSCGLQGLITRRQPTRRGAWVRLYWSCRRPGCRFEARTWWEGELFGAYPRWLYSRRAT